MNIGKAIRRYRKLRQMTLVEVSEASGISVSHLSDVERGKNSISLRKLNDIARVLNLRTSMLVIKGEQYHDRTTQ